jgi:hypothetical protein
MVELLLNRIAKPGRDPEQITMPTELIKRESCRAIHSSEEVSVRATTQHGITI